MPSITTWTRLEPRARADDLDAALRAPIADPAWLLARQWQLGELAGADAGSVTSARIRATAAHLTVLAGPAAKPRTIDGPKAAIEPLIEAEPLTPADRWLAAEAGQHFLRLLKQHGEAGYDQPYVAAYPFAGPAAGDPTVDPAAAGRLALLAGRIPDGTRLAAALRRTVRPPSGKPGLPAKPPVAAADEAAVLAAARAFLTWYDAFVTGPVTGGSWAADRMEYQFQAAAPSAGRGCTLAAPRYDGGLVDWDDFVVQQGGTLAGAAVADQLVAGSVPVPVSYPGMPSPRYWTFDDAGTSLGAATAGPADLATLLLIEFVTVYAGDWHVVPLQVPAGTLCDVGSVVVTDSFGTEVLIPPAASYDAGAGPGTGGGWGMFSLSSFGADGSPGAPVSMLLIPPTIGHAADSEPIEDVLFLRDDAADLAWAIEQTVQSPLGTAVDRSGALRAAEQPPPVHQPLAELVYQLRSPVPANWIPFVPAGAGPGMLRRSALEGGAFGGPLTPVPPAGRILQPGAPLAVYTEEIPRSGTRVSRAWRYGRSPDGTCYLWVGRRRVPGGGESSSALRYDTLLPGLPPGG